MYLASLLALNQFIKITKNSSHKNKINSLQKEYMEHLNPSLPEIWNNWNGIQTHNLIACKQIHLGTLAYLAYIVIYYLQPIQSI